MSTRNRPVCKGRPARYADNFTAICEPIVYKVREPRHVTTLWAFTARCKDRFTHRILIGRHEGKGHLGRTGNNWKKNSKSEHVGYEVLNGVHLAQSRIQWWDVCGHDNETLDSRKDGKFKNNWAITTLVFQLMEFANCIKLTREWSDPTYRNLPWIFFPLQVYTQQNPLWKF
jgi:hypothetical protein